MNVRSKESRVFDQFTEFPRQVGSVHLGVVGIINALSGVGLVYASGSDRLLAVLVQTLLAATDDLSVLMNGPAIEAVATYGALITGLCLFGLAVGQISGARNAYAGQKWSHAMTFGFSGLLNPLSLPLALIAVVLTWLTKHQFD